MNWSVDAGGLVDALALAAPREGGARPVVCVGVEPAPSVDAQVDERTRAVMRYVEAPRASDDVDGLVRVLRDLDIASARAVIVRPDMEAREPDANSRVAAVAVARACVDRSPPNMLVEVRDPEAAYEFAGLGVATVFYPGYLRAALLAQACVDLGVFQFVYGLLRDVYRIQLLPLEEELRSGTFLDAVLANETDANGDPITLIGIQQRPAPEAAHPRDGTLVINPGPRASLANAVGLLALENR